MESYNRIRNTILCYFPEHREESRIEILAEAMMAEIRSNAVNFARYAAENPGENFSELFNKYEETAAKAY